MKKFKTIFFFLTLIFFVACSIGINVFIINSSEKDYTIEAYFNRHIDEITENNYLSMNYKDSIINIDKKTIDFLENEIQYQIIDSSTISIVIPKKSTVHFCRTSNHFMFLDSIKIIEKNQIITRDKFVKGKGSNFFYDIK